MIIASDLIAGYTDNSSFPRFSRHEILLYLFREGASRGGKREKVFSSSLSPLTSEVGLLPLINFLGEKKFLRFPLSKECIFHALTKANSSWKVWERELMRFFKISEQNPFLNFPFFGKSTWVGRERCFRITHVDFRLLFDLWLFPFGLAVPPPFNISWWGREEKSIGKPNEKKAGNRVEVGKRKKSILQGERDEIKLLFLPQILS